MVLGDALETYTDPYGFDEAVTWPAAAVRPESVRQVQAVVRLATRYRFAVWPVSHGRNLGYGGAGARFADSVVVGLGRLDRILAVDEKTGCAIVEPGARSSCWPSICGRWRRD